MQDTTRYPTINLGWADKSNDPVCRPSQSSLCDGRHMAAHLPRATVPPRFGRSVRRPRRFDLRACQPTAWRWCFDCVLAEGRRRSSVSHGAPDATRIAGDCVTMTSRASRARASVAAASGQGRTGHCHSCSRAIRTRKERVQPEAPSPSYSGIGQALFQGACSKPKRMFVPRLGLYGTAPRQANGGLFQATHLRNLPSPTTKPDVER